MATCTIQPPAFSGSVSGCGIDGVVVVARVARIDGDERRARAGRCGPPASARSSASLSAITLSGKSSGMPWACTAIRLILRWSSGLPSASRTRACGTLKRPCGRGRSARDRRPWPRLRRPSAIDHSRSSLRSTGSIVPPPLRVRAEDAEQAALLARQALDRCGFEAVAARRRRPRASVMRARMRSPTPIARLDLGLRSAAPAGGSSTAGRSPSSLPDGRLGR